MSRGLADFRINLPGRFLERRGQSGIRLFETLHDPLGWHKGSGLDCGSGDPGLIPSIHSLCVGPLMVKQLKKSWDIRCLCPGRLSILQTPSLYRLYCCRWHKCFTNASYFSTALYNNRWNMIKTVNKIAINFGGQKFVVSDTGPNGTTPDYISLLVFSEPELKAQVHYCDHPLSVFHPSSLTFYIFYFFSETAERKSTELDRKQDLNVLCQVCVFRADLKNKMATLPSDWLIHFQLLL